MSTSQVIAAVTKNRSRKAPRRKATPQHMVAKNDKAIQDLIVKYKLNTSGRVVIDGGTNGTDRVTPSTMKRYQPIWKAFVDFCALVGDPQSAMMFNRDLDVLDPLPPKPQTMCMFAQYRANQDPDAKLVHPNTKELVKDVDGNEITCLGDYRATSSFKIMKQAFTKVLLHYQEHYERSYIEPCEDCCKLPPHRVRQGCDKHMNMPRIRPSGDPRKHPDYERVMNKWYKHVDERSDPYATLQLEPCELRDIRDHLLSCSEPKEGLMWWTILIVSIDAFLRGDEGVNLDLETNFFPVENLNIVVGDDIKSVAMQVKGKQDTHFHKLYLNKCNEYPDINGLTALLTWMEVSGIKSGRLFPQVTYEQFLEKMKVLVIEVLGRNPEEDKCIIGTHMCRKKQGTCRRFGVTAR